MEAAVVPVFEGVLSEISGGSSIHGSSGVPSEAIRAAATQGANVTHREFLVIGGQRIMDVSLSNRHDALLVSSVGQAVKITAFKRGKEHMVVGVRLADGTVDKMGIWGSVLANTAYVATPTIFLVIVGFLSLAIFSAPIVALIAFGLAAFIVRKLVVTAMRMSAARSEL